MWETVRGSPTFLHAETFRLVVVVLTYVVSIFMSLSVIGRSKYSSSCVGIYTKGPLLGRGILLAVDINSWT
jgi:hypothetical protein